jgi:hypothetical protein
MSRSGVGCRFKKIASGDTRLFTLSISDVAVKARCVKHPGCWMFLMLARAPTQINAIDILTSASWLAAFKDAANLIKGDELQRSILGHPPFRRALRHCDAMTQDPEPGDDWSRGAKCDSTGGR